MAVFTATGSRTYTSAMCGVVQSTTVTMTRLKSPGGRLARQSPTCSSTQFLVRALCGGGAGAVVAVAVAACADGAAGLGLGAGSVRPHPLSTTAAASVRLQQRVTRSAEIAVTLAHELQQ